jgi:hypothetical protein
MPIDKPLEYDPYRDCAHTCTHDLAEGMLLIEIRNGDGPWKEKEGRWQHSPVSAGVGMTLQSIGSIGE